MKNRTRLTVVFAVLLVLALSLAACEKDRPVQTPTSGTAQPQSGQALTTTPSSNATRGAVSADTTTTSASSSTSQGTASASGTSAPKPAASSAAMSGSATKVPAQSIVYTVQLGDTLGGIAKEFGVSAEAIIQANSLADPDVLMVGQELKIPGTQAEPGKTTESGNSSRGGESTYIVSLGDTLGIIARRYGVSVAELQDLNGIADPNQISVGQELRIPGAASKGSETPTSSEQKTYVVQQGDTLFKIALRFGITLESLETANNITDPNKVYPGQVLKIP
jgi:lysozyme